MVGRDGGSWDDSDVVARYATSGFSDPGERAALTAVGDRRRGRVLDLGVGGGRTTGLLIADATSYVGIDPAPAMLAVARRRHPEADLRLGDVRDLRGLAGFDLVVFSLNGLDVLDHRDRAVAAGELARVLAADGRLVFSSLNLDGVSFDERPWSVRGIRGGRALAHARRAIRHPRAWAASVASYRAIRTRSVDGDGWAMRPLREHGFRFLVHFATPAATVAVLHAVGLEVECAFTDRGVPLPAAAARSEADYVHYVCRRARTQDAGGD